jgi:Reverse transcriptase (RNA-dependent DNA polymerase)
LEKLLPFGCSVFVKVETHRAKLDDNSFQAFIIGYDLTSQGHKIFNPNTGRTTITVNVQADLSSFYSDQSTQQISMVPLISDVSDEVFSTNISSSISEIAEEVPLSPLTPVPKCNLIDDFDDFATPSSAVSSTPSSSFAFTAAPSSLLKALQGPDNLQWEASIKREYDAMVENLVWEAVKDVGQRRMRSMFVLKIKDDGTLRTRIVACGSTQIPGPDYNIDEISSSVLKSISMKLIFCKALEMGYPVYHIDCVTAFLNSPAKFENYMELPKILVDTLSLAPLVKLLKGLYGTHDAPRLWWDLLHNVLVTDMKFVQSTADQCLYLHSSKDMLAGVYVDDLPLVASPENYKWFVETLSKFFKLTDKGIMTKCLGMDVVQEIVDNKLVSVKLHQLSYINDVLDRFGFQDCHAVFTPAVPNTYLTLEMEDYSGQVKDHKSSKISIASYPSVVGCLLWISLCTRPEISQAVSQLSRFVHKPCLAHLTAVKHVLRYLAGSRDLGLTFNSKANNIPTVYSDATWGSDPTSQRSMSAYCVLFYGAVISWHCGLQKSVSLSTTESEWYALSECTKECMYLQHALSQFKFKAVKDWMAEPILVKEDNQGVIKIAIGEVKHKHQKHILLRLSYVREAIQAKTIRLEYVPSADNIADILTKNLPKEPFVRLRSMLLG